MQSYYRAERSLFRQAELLPNWGTMDWDGYTVFSVISGIACILLSVFAKDVSNKNRLWAVAAGVFCIGYGMYVAAQDSGTYYFSSYIFILPFLLGGILVYDMIKKKAPAAPSEVANPMDKVQATTAIRVPQQPQVAPPDPQVQVSDLSSAPPPAGRGPQPAQGWYEDPLSSSYRLRYWDGQAWTERVD